MFAGVFVCELDDFYVQYSIKNLMFTSVFDCLLEYLLVLSISLFSRLLVCLSEYWFDYGVMFFAEVFLGLLKYLIITIVLYCLPEHLFLKS